MKISIDTVLRKVEVESGDSRRSMDLFSKESFELLSDLWLKVGWDQKYSYTFTWMGRPVIQLPEDMVRMQEVIYRIKPDVIIETGIAHGGSLIFYASLCKAMGKGRVVGVDVEIRPHNRTAIEAHELYSYITLIEGSSIDPEIVRRVRDLIHEQDVVLVILDSNHSKSHVLRELEAYGPLVTAGSYIVATDGLMKQVADVPRGNLGWLHDNPADAAREFSEKNPSFVLQPPAWPFNESRLGRNVTHWLDAWLRKS